MRTVRRRKRRYHQQPRRHDFYSSRRPERKPRMWMFRLRWLLILLIVISIPVVSQIMVLDRKVRAQFEGKRWELPARVYASPLELHIGKHLNARDFIRELGALNYREVVNVTEPGQFRRKGNSVYLMTRPMSFWDAKEEGRSLRLLFSRGGELTRITDLEARRNLNILRMEPRLLGKIYPTHKEDRILVKLDQVPQHLIDALLTMEDRAFYSHGGISLRGMARAFVQNMLSGRVRQGGSTLTQQLVKNLLLTPERTVTRKLKEAAMAMLLEAHYTKEEILQAYLNEVYFGQDGKYSIHGVGTAAWFYFNKPVERLKVQESALLVGLLRATSQYNPHRHIAKALERRELVLRKMHEQGFLSQEEAEAAVQSPLEVMDSQWPSDSPYPAFLDLVRRQLQRDYREEDLRSAGLQIFTTLDPFVQHKAERALMVQARQLERSSKARKLEGAVVVTSTSTGEILGLVGGRNPRYDGFNRALNAMRPIGSLVKAAIYLAALEDNKHYSLISTLYDKPFEWKGRNSQEVWTPKNYDGRLHGRVPLIQALTYSYNLATVHLGFAVGLEKVKETIRKLGVDRDFPAYPSMLLGGTSMSPLDVAQMYQTLANGGFQTPVRAIREVMTHDGQPLKRYALSGKQRFNPAPVYVLNHALRQVITHGTGRATAKAMLPKDMVLAGKTGTSNDLRDSWFAGFSQDYLAVAWLGRDDNKTIHLTGGSGAMRVWAELMGNLDAGSLDLPPPPGIQWRWANIDSGRQKLPFFVGGNQVLTDSDADTTMYAWVR